jgi:hypothetical protein
LNSISKFQVHFEFQHRISSSFWFRGDCDRWHWLGSRAGQAAAAGPDSSASPPLEGVKVVGKPSVVDTLRTAVCHISAGLAAVAANSAAALAQADSNREALFAALTTRHDEITSAITRASDVARVALECLGLLRAVRARARAGDDFCA